MTDSTTTTTDRPTDTPVVPVDTAPAPAPAVSVPDALAAASAESADALVTTLDNLYRVTDSAARYSYATDMDCMSAVFAHRDVDAVTSAWSRFVTAPDYVDPYAAIVADVAVLYAATLDRLSTVDAVDMDRVIADAMALGEFADDVTVQRTVSATRPLTATTVTSGDRTHFDRDYTVTVGRTYHGSGGRSAYTMHVDAADPSGYPGSYTVTDGKGATVGTFQSPTAAAVAVTGCSTRGPAFWRVGARGTADHAISIGQVAAR